jgi:oxygen-independent coproporphyrinogen-3 oxidase
LAGALTLAPEHLSLYALTLEEGTLLAEQVAAHALPAPDDDTVATMYEEAEAALDVAGYTHYEISNWARRNAQDTPGRPRFACQHNLVYWHNRAYLGLGAAAHSYDGARRSANTPELAEYIARATADQDATSQSEELAPPARMGETMMLELRLLAGVGREEFAQRFGVGLDEEYGREIVELVEDGLLVADAAGIRLSARGRLLGNRVFAAFLRP